MAPIFGRGEKRVEDCQGGYRFKDDLNADRAISTDYLRDALLQMSNGHSDE